MTTLFSNSKKCGYCKKTVRVIELSSTNAFGSPDLDFRPPPMKRSAILRALQCCEHCGYAAWDLETTVQKSDELSDLLSEKIDFSDRSQVFERAAKIARLNSANKERSNYLYLCAAWSADDAADIPRAQAMRKNILAVFPADLPQRPEQMLQWIDIARRAGEWDTARELLEKFKAYTVDQKLKNIAQFQSKLLDEKDTECHTIEEAL